MPWRYDEVFNDPTPNGIVNQRIITTFVQVAERTEMESKEKQDFLNLLLLIGKKLIGTWKHVQDYIGTEDYLIEQAKKAEPIEKQEFQKISYSLDLFLEFDGFFVQTKSTLDYLVKIPIPILGKNVWPLRTFSDKGQAVMKALQRNVPRKYEDKVRLIQSLIGPHLPWLAPVIETRDRINHFLDGGIDFRTFIVVKRVKDDGESIHVPIWQPGMTVRQVLEETWSNLLLLTEDFIGGFLLLRLPQEYCAARIPTAPDIPHSCWKFFASKEEGEEFKRRISDKWKTF